MEDSLNQQLLEYLERQAEKFKVIELPVQM